MKSKKIGKSTTFRPTSLLYRNHLVLAASLVADKRRTSMTHRETNLDSSEDWQEDHAADLRDQPAHVAINFETSL
jgi:hypothetical protein